MFDDPPGGWPGYDAIMGKNTDLIVMQMTGFEKLDRKMRMMPVRLQKQALRTGCRNAAKFVRQLVLAKVPRKTGALAKSIVVRAGKRSRRYKDQVVVQVRTKDGFFKGDEFYGAMLEFGTEERKTKKGAGRGRIPELRFFRDGLESFLDRKRRIFQKAVRDFVIRESRRK